MLNIEEKCDSFFDDNNVNNLLWKKNKKDLYTLFFINKYVIFVNECRINYLSEVK